MDGLEALTSPIGPGMSAYNAGVKTSADAANAQSEQALRQAQMQEIIQRTNAARESAPLDLQKKQHDLQKSELEMKIKKNDIYTNVLNTAASQLEAIPPAARHAQLMNMIQGSGVNMNDPEVSGFMQQLQNVPGEKLTGVLGAVRDHLNTSSAEYRKAIDVANIQKESHIAGAKEAAAASRYSSDQRAAAQAAKNKGTTTIQEAFRSGKMTAEKAAVALYGAAQFEADPAEAQRLTDMAKQYEQFAMNQRNAQAGGKVDVGAASGLPTQTITPALGGAPAPAAQPHAMADLQKMYPGVSDAQLKQAYKNKFGVEPK